MMPAPTALLRRPEELAQGQATTSPQVGESGLNRWKLFPEPFYRQIVKMMYWPTLPPPLTWGLIRSPWRQKLRCR